MPIILKQSRHDHAVAVLRKLGWVRASDFGWALWGKTTEYPGRGQGSHAQNKFCRSAGKLLRELERMGLAINKFEDTSKVWRATKGAPRED